MNATGSYLTAPAGGHEAEIERLERGARSKRNSEQWWRRRGLRPNGTAYDIGCAGGAFTRKIARYCKKVIGSDREEKFLSAASELARGLDNVSFQQLDIAKEDLPYGADFIYARLVMQHLPNSPWILVRIGTALQPGGTLLIEDLSWSLTELLPANESWHKLKSWALKGQLGRGGNPDAGALVGPLMESVGFLDVKTEATLREEKITRSHPIPDYWVWLAPELARDEAERCHRDANKFASANRSRLYASWFVTTGRKRQ